MEILTRQAVVDMGNGSYCALFVGDGNLEPFFIPFLIEGEMADFVFEAMNGDLNNPYAVGVAILLSSLSQCDMANVFVELSYDRRRGESCAHFAVYYDSGAGRKFYRIEIPFYYGLILPTLSADVEIQTIVDSESAKLLGRKIQDLESFMNKDRKRE
jgi:hypothetical protein